MNRVLLIFIILFFSCQKEQHIAEDRIIIKGKVSLIDGEFRKGVLTYRPSWLISSQPKFIDIASDGQFEIELTTEDHVSMGFGHEGYEPKGLEFDPQFGNIYEFNVILDKYQKSPNGDYYVVHDATGFQITNQNQKMTKTSNGYTWSYDFKTDTMPSFRYQINYPGYRTFQGSSNVNGYDRSIDFYSHADVVDGKTSITFNDGFMRNQSSQSRFEDVQNMEYRLSVIDFYDLNRQYSTIVNDKKTKNEFDEVGLETLFSSLQDLIASKKADKTKWYLSYLAHRFYYQFTNQFYQDSQKAEKYAQSNIQEALYENYNIVSSIASLNAKEKNLVDDAKEEYIELFYKDLLEQKLGSYTKLRVYQSLADHYKFVKNDDLAYNDYCDKILAEFPDTYNARSIRQERATKEKKG